MIHHDAELGYREEVRPSDLARVREMVGSSGIFSAEEVLLATELVYSVICLLEINFRNYVE